MSVLDGFKIIELKEKIEDTYLTITAKSLKMNRAREYSRKPASDAYW